METGYDEKEIQDLNQDFATMNLREKPVENSKTGAWKAAGFIYALDAGDSQLSLSVSINLVPYLVAIMHQPTATAANIANNFSGTNFLLSILGGYIADSHLGNFKAIIVGNVASSLGLALLIFSTAYSGLQPASCLPPGPTETQCAPAGARYMAPLYLALYATAVGSGFVKPSCVALGADQFDDSSLVEKSQSVHFFAWFYFVTNTTELVALTVGIYLQDDVSRSWGYAFTLALYLTCITIFFVGAPKLRCKQLVGSFLTRTGQVLVAAVRKQSIPLPGHNDELYDAPLPGNVRLTRTLQLRFLDKAAVMETGVTSDPSRWRLCGVSQVEETKRILQLLPIWATSCGVSLVFSQLVSFTIQQAQTLDRSLGPSFQIPTASVGVILILSAFIIVPTYDWLLVPFARRFTKHSLGFSPLQRLGASIVFAVLTMITAAIVERRRLTYVRELHLEALPLGAYALPMKLWWLVPQFFLAAFVEFFLFVPSYEFYYHEAAAGTRSIASSFIYAALAMGYYFSSVLVNIVNRATRDNQGGSWLEGNLNDGGLEKFYWLLAVILAVNFLLYLPCAHWYRYKYEWSHNSAEGGAARRPPKFHSSQFTSTNLDGDIDHLTCSWHT